jgi:hypothetical protein
VDAEHPVVVLLEVEGEGLEAPGGAEPDEAVRALVDARAEAGRGLGAEDARHAIRGDHEIGLGQVAAGADLDPVADLDAETQRLVPQDAKQGRARDAAEAVAGRAQDLAVIVDVDVVPVMEARLQAIDGDRIRGREVPHRRVGEHDAEAERVVGLMPLEEGDLVRRVFLLEEDREIQRGGTRTRRHHFHDSDLRSWDAMSRCWISVVPS